MGRITRVGKNSLRATLVQASWALIRKDGVMQKKYDRLKVRSGGKRAIVAVARTLLIRMRRMLLDNNPYVIGLVAAN
jgi:transposase